MMRKHASRLFVTAAALLVIGAAVNWLVAIRYASLPPPFHEPVELSDQSITTLLERAGIEPEAHESIFDAGKAHRRGMVRQFVMLYGVTDDGEMSHREAIADEVGWPFLSFSTLTVVELEIERRQYRTHSAGVWRADAGNTLDRINLGVIPYGVRPIGFLSGSVFYAMPAGVIWLIMLRMRRRTRLDAGRCPMCRYDLRDLPRGDRITCPECGNAIQTRLLDRPRQPLRWWMLPLVLPVPALFALFWVGEIDWTWMRMHLAQHAWPPALPNVLVLTGLLLWSSVIAWYTYPDRLPRWRIMLTIVVSGGIVLFCMIPSFLLSIWFISA